ncbi:MAG: hypothetical protein WC829_14650 [Hyphomicrobium sp.]|jgi:hypothetical protein
MATKVQRLGKNSATNVVKLVSELSEQVALPAGVILRNEAEMVIWQQFTHARAREGWRDFDLLIVAKAVRLEADIRKYQQTLDGEGAVVTNDRGTPIVNPFLTVIDSLQRQQLALIRSLSLNQQGQDPRTLNSQGKEQSKLRKSINSFDDLIAR